MPQGIREYMAGRVCIVVVTYNSARYIKGCFESLRRQTYGDLAIVVVDNASSDGSAGLVRGYGVHLIENRVNVGFAAANNEGARYGLNTLGCDYLLLMNPDTVAHERLVEELVATLEGAEGAAIAQGKLFLMDERELINAAGIHHHYLYFGSCEGYRGRDTDGSDREVAVASGACLMIKGKALAALGYLFNEDFFMYHEDTDLCIRARLMGYRVMLSGGAAAWHDYRFSSSKVKFFHMEKNRLFLLLQNYSAPTLLLLLPAILFTEAQVLAYSLMGGWFGYKLKSYLWLLGNMRKVAERRRSVQAARVVDDASLLKLFSTDIKFDELDNPGLTFITNPALKAYYRLVVGVLRLGRGRDGR